MSTRPSTLMDDAAFGEIGKKNSIKRSGDGNRQTVKALLVALCFLIGGAGLTYYYWPEAPVASARGGKGSLTAEEQEAARQQAQKAAEDLADPTLPNGPS